MELSSSDGKRPQPPPLHEEHLSIHPSPSPSILSLLLVAWSSLTLFIIFFLPRFLPPPSPFYLFSLSLVFLLPLFCFELNQSKLVEYIDIYQDSSTVMLTIRSLFGVQAGLKSFVPTVSFSCSLLWTMFQPVERYCPLNIDLNKDIKISTFIWLFTLSMYTSFNMLEDTVFHSCHCCAVWQLKTKILSFIF